MTLLVVASSVWNVKNLDKQAGYLATEEARSNWNKDQAFRRWATRHGGLYVKPNERTPPNPYLGHLPHRDVETTDGAKLTLMNPAHMMSQMTKEYESTYGIKGSITGQVLLNPKNKADPWELKALKQFDKGAKEVAEQTLIDGQPYLRLMRPMVMKKGCVLCHGHLGFKVGDIRGGVSISVPLTPYFAAARESKTFLLSTHGTFWAIGMLTIGFVSWRGQKREIERKKAEERFSGATESMQEGFILFDADDRLVAINDVFRHINPKAQEFLDKGMTFEEMVRENVKRGWFVEAKDREEEFIRERLEQHRNPGSPIIRQYSNGKYYQIMESRTPENGFAITFVDITELKKAEEDVKASETRLSGILEIAPEAVVTIGTNMNIQLFNKGAERIFGYSSEEVLGQPLEILMPKNFRKNHQSHVDDFDNSGDTYLQTGKLQEIFGLRKDGTKFPASASISKLEIGGEKIYTVMLQDITERKQAEEDRRIALVDAERANQAKSEFLATMSHELRTPLNAILGFSDILSNQYLGPPGAGKYREYANDIHASGEHLLELVNDLLDLSTIEAGKQSLNKERLVVNELVAECFNALGQKAQEKGIKQVTEVSKNLPPLYADRRSTRQIFLNLLTNAVKFTPEGGKITISAKATDLKTIFKVADTGLGISVDKLPKLTEPFMRGELDPHKTVEGWGLGLAITKSLVELHDGEMDIESTVGKGTTVTVMLPNAEA